MTDATPPRLYQGWEPITEGVDVTFEWNGVETHLGLPMPDVRELRDDMEEADYLSRGCEKVECFVKDIQQHDRIKLMNDTYRVHDLLTSQEVRFGRPVTVWVIQFELNAHDDTGGSELTLPGDLLVTVWRPIG